MFRTVKDGKRWTIAQSEEEAWERFAAAVREKFGEPAEPEIDEG